jgi:hypothetical protein
MHIIQGHEKTPFVSDSLALCDVKFSSVILAEFECHLLV